MCVIYVARKNVILVFPKEYEEYAKRYQEMTAKLKYPNAEMEKELSNYVPKPVTDCRLADGSVFLAIEKKEGVYPLRMLGVLIDRHVAWVISRLENLCCLLEYNDMVLNGFTVDNLFVDPANHQIYLYGGWWFAGYEGAEAVGASAQNMKYLEKRSLIGKGRNRGATDLESIRLTAAKLLGFPDRESLKDTKLLPEAFRDFLTGKPKQSAGKDFSYWDDVLEKSYGERKFIPLSVTEEEIYSRT